MAVHHSESAGRVATRTWTRVRLTTSPASGGWNVLRPTWAADMRSSSVDARRVGTSPRIRRGGGDPSHAFEV
jgi:hypothetical protein